MKEITNVSYMRRKKVRKQNKISIYVATRPLWDLRKIESDLSLVWLPLPFPPLPSPTLSSPPPSLPLLSPFPLLPLPFPAPPSLSPPLPSSPPPLSFLSPTLPFPPYLSSPPPLPTRICLLHAWINKNHSRARHFCETDSWIM